MSYDGEEKIISSLGGRLDNSSLNWPARQHLDFTKQLLSPFLKPTVVPGHGGCVATTPPSKISQFLFADRWNLGAFAALANENPVVVFNAGIPFALFDYFNAMMATRVVFEKFESTIEDTDFALPLRTFEHAPKQSIPKSPIIHFWSDLVERRPKSEIRAQLASELFVTATYFLFLHELGHIDQGHLELLNRRKGTSTMTEFFSASGGPAGSLSRSEQHYLEYDADYYSASQLANTCKPKARLHTSDWEEDDIDRCQVLFFCIGALFLFLEYQSPRRTGIFARIFNRRSGHPATFDRLIAVNKMLALNIMESGVIASDAVLKAELQAYVDIATVADLLGLDPKPLYTINQRFRDSIQTFNKVDHLEEELRVCREAVSKHYFLDGDRVRDDQLHNIDADDIWHLKDQTVVRIVDDEKIEIRFPDQNEGPSAFVHNAKQWERAGCIDAALSNYEVALALDPDHKPARSGKSRLLERLGGHAHLVSKILQKPKRKVHFADDLIELGSNNPDLQEGIDQLSCVTLLRPREGEAFAYRGRLRYLLSDWEQALSDSTISLEIGLNEELEATTWTEKGNALV